jgi:predicted transcriptional regulator
MSPEIRDDYMQIVAAIYQDTGSLQRTADELGIAYAKVRKILITTGQYETKFSEEVFSLRSKGFTIEEIACELGATPKRVSAWLPYERIIYNTPDRSQEAIRSVNYRARIKIAQEKSVLNKYMKNKERRDNMSTNKNTRSKSSSRTADEPVRLHLKLSDEWIDEDGRRVMMKYGRSSSGTSIERDILIPGDMTLHYLHYAIQKLFGWQNSHLHSFHIPENDYSRLTNNTVRGWGSLIGVLFQTVYPPDVWHEIYGDDDYKSGSFKTWLRKKYTGPYGYLGVYEIFDNAVYEFNDFVDRFPGIDVHEPFDYTKKEVSIIKKAPVIELTLAELNNSLFLESGTDELLERLLVTSVLAPAGKETATAEDLNKKMIKRYYDKYGEVEEPEIKPVTDKLFYHYDYGDSWIVEITRLENCNDLIENNLLTIEEYGEAQKSVVEKYKPVCIHQDGMFVVDDVGGLGGFIDLLRTLYEPDDIEEKREMQSWAQYMGWSARKVSNQALL